MINIDISFNWGKTERLLRDLPGKFETARKNALMAIGQTVASRATLSFRTPSFRPSPWAPRKNNADPGRPLLHKSGALRRSISWKLLGDDAVVVGTDRTYAPFHQHGTKNMPARPFMPVDGNGRLTPAVESKIAKIVERAAADMLSGL